MELPLSYFEPECVKDDDYIHINDHLLYLGDISNDFEQLIAELYDDCMHVDRNIIHELIIDICKKLEADEPKLEDLKINKEMKSEAF